MTLEQLLQLNVVSRLKKVTKLPIVIPMRKLLKTILSLWVMLTFTGLAHAQMLVGTDTLYGNEWINYDQSYFKIPVAKDGLYRIDAQVLQSAGISISGFSANQLRLYHMGKEVPIHVSTGGMLSDNDFLLFWGKQNKGEFDTYLFEDPAEHQLNPLYSLVTDTSAYYLTWSSTSSSTRLETLNTDLTNAPEQEAWVWQQAGEVFTEKFMKNYTRRSGITIYFSHYDVAEGYGNRNINELLQSGNTTQDFSLDLPNAYIGGPSARFTARFGVGEGNHKQIVQIDGATYFDRTYNDIAVKAPDFNFPLTDDGIDIRFAGQADDRDEQSIAYYRVDYPSLPDASNQSLYTFEVDGSSSPKYLEIADFNSSTGQPILYDLTNGLRIRCRYENGLVKALLPASSDRRSLVLIEETSATPIASLQLVNFPNLLAQETEFLILTAPQLRAPYENQDQVQAYADYRASAAGGNYQTQIVEVEDIYHQFGYGLSRHPQSIRNFAHAAHRQWPNLQYVFIIGKGREYPSLRTADGLANALAAETFFVPSFGFPASDNLMLSTNTSSVAVVPVGRIAATTPKEISIYLKKVETLEATANNEQTIEERAWMKNIMHLGGGGNSSEQNAIKSNLERMAREIEGNLFGGKVTPFYKTSTDPIQQSRSQQIFDRINQGTAVITFFGHSSPGTFDFNIDNPDNYENFGKFPLIMSLGCYSGNFFTSSKGIGERFTFYEDKASVAFGASRGVGFISTLGAFADRFYEKMGGEKYGRGIGDIVSATRASFDHLTGLEIKTIVEQFSLMGDPSIRLHPSPGPDYVVDRSSVEFSPKVISIQEDSFQLAFEVLNLGQFIQDSISVDIRQKLPGGEEIQVKRLRIATPAYASHHTVNLATQGKASIGLNTFFIDVDVQDEVDELPAPAGEMNNSLVRADGQAGVNLFIVDNTARPVYPPKFALVGSAPVTLKSSTSDALAPERKYLLEIDTTHLFDSPLKERTEIVQRGGVIKWTPSLPLQDSTVYYWRISPDSTEAEIGYVWESSSFTYIEGSPNGWGQGHWGQWLEGDFDGLVLENTSTPFRFDNQLINVKIRNKVYDSQDRPGLVYNNENFAASVRPWLYLNEGLAVVVSNPETASFWRNRSGDVPFEPGDYGIPTGGSRVFAFPTQNTAERTNFVDFLTEVVPSGYIVFVFSILDSVDADLMARNWALDSLSADVNIFQVLESEGATQVRQLADQRAVPYIFIYTKGEGSFGEKIGLSVDSDIFEDVDIPRFLTVGSYHSPLIGPVARWGRVLWESDFFEHDKDSLRIDLYGINTNEETSLIVENIVGGELDISFVDPRQYPRLYLRLIATDELDRTPVQINYWQVLYEGLPEVALELSESSNELRDSFEIGEIVSITCQVRNLSNFEMDSLLMRYILEDSKGNLVEHERRLASLDKKEVLPFNIQLQTDSLEGIVSITVEINPDGDQPELSDFNNILNWSFLLERDNKSPQLDVTFDGSQIMEGDLVSPDVTVLISLADENRYLPLEDTNLISVQLEFPDGSLKDFNASMENVTFITEFSAQKNRIRVELTPKLEQDGIYKLIVKAKDASGNDVGHIAYQKSFKVINRNAISNVLNYPNPFSTSTQFVYTLTGRSPTYFGIQIATLSGRVVREIRAEEIGELKAGTHRTDFIWDGTDEFGDQLANGVYLFRVIARDEQGEDFEHHSSTIDPYFQKGWGKLVILR